ncbi:valine--tRNA ligase-like isoform X3 [Scylla paramamosain]|uniref:valine--tRNA ligase-like isoform X3 n=1 Tax=Scylla paramamosain TaxID=85552 RepID=UPI003083E224
MQRETGLCVCLYILTEAFVRPYDAGLVYRKEALVNWCCSLQSAILDIEVDHLHLTGPTELAVPGYSKPVSFGKMWDFPYRLADSGSFGARSRHRRRPRLCRAAVSTWCHSCTGGLGIAGWTTSQDWCVSRQLWWGRRMPVYHITAADGEEVWVAAARRRMQGGRLWRRKEEDLDTCYSSGPSLCLAGLARSGEGRDHARFYATTLKTGHGILFWVAQVVMPGLDLTGWLSFETVLLHGLQGDGGGHKTSKSWGSVIDPLDVISGASLEVCDLLVLCVLYWCSLAVVSSTLTAGIPDCGADALWSTLCSTSFRKPSPQTMSGGGCVLR